MLSKKIKKSLQSILGPERFFDDPITILAHSYDAYIEEAQASAVLFPTETAEISEIMKVARSEQIPVTTRGSGTNLSGGTIPVQGGVVLSLTRMNKILEIASQDRYAVVEPGVINGDLQKALSEYGFFFPPDPSSYAISTLGGNIAENAGGPRCLKYGVTSDYVMGLEVVLASGNIIRLGSPNIKDVTGYRPAGLFCGSEGTLGVITRAIVRIVPRPKAKRTALIVYDDLDDTARTVAEIIEEGIVPAAMELMDNVIINLVEDALDIGMPRDAEGVLIIDVDGKSEAVQDEIQQVERIAKKNKARQTLVASSEMESEALWKGRRSVYSVLNRLSPTVVVEDATVPVSKIPAMLRGCKDIAKKYDIKISICGHAGDGNLHPSINTDSRDRDEWQRVERAIREIFRLALDLGGCLSGEHGIGLAKKEFLPMAMNDDSLEFLSLIKKAVDPTNILNPGKFAE